MLIPLLFLTVSIAVSQQCTNYPENPAGSFNVTILVDGQNRTFQLFSPWNEFSCGPNSYCVGPPKVPRPLVINWHGCNSHVPVVKIRPYKIIFSLMTICTQVAYQEQISRIEQAASDYNYYSITPVGTLEPLMQDYGWNTNGVKCGSPGADDFLFAEKLLEYAENHLCVDTSRVYSTGFSTGGFHSYALGCHMTSKFAGIAPIAGSIGKHYFDECKYGDAISVLSFHSKDDKTVPYDGNIDWESQSTITTMWELRNGCTNETDIVTYESETTVCHRKECPGAAVEECTLIGLDHCWVGGRSGGFFTPGSCAKQPGDVDATSHMFETWEREAAAKKSKHN